jgi:hypothetical protein
MSNKPILKDNVGSFPLVHKDGPLTGNQLSKALDMARARFTPEELAELDAHLAIATPEQTTLAYARQLAMRLWQKHYAETAPHWEPLPDLMGLLTQIDNMVSPLVVPE